MTGASHIVALRYADTGQQTPLPIPSDRPMLIVSYGSLNDVDAAAAINRADYRHFGRVTLIGASPEPGITRPEWEAVGPECVEMLPTASRLMGAMRLALDSVLSGGNKNRRTLFGPELAMLERDPYTSTLRTTLCGPHRRGTVDRAGPPASWPAELLDALLPDCERAVLDSEQPLPEVWRGRPAGGRSYLRIMAAPRDHHAWREAIRKRSPDAEIRCAPDRLRRAR